MTNIITAISPALLAPVAFVAASLTVAAKVKSTAPTKLFHLHLHPTQARLHPVPTQVARPQSYSELANPRALELVIGDGQAQRLMTAIRISPLEYQWSPDHKDRSLLLPEETTTDVRESSASFHPSRRLSPNISPHLDENLTRSHLTIPVFAANPQSDMPSTDRMAWTEQTISREVCG